jgi:hypothetical protein
LLGLGSHGAGLTNMMFSRKSTTTIIEFAMKPHVDRCFGYLSMAFDLDYWLVPQISANYFARSTVDADKAKLVTNLVRSIIQNKQKNKEDHKGPVVITSHQKELRSKILLDSITQV